MDWGNTLHQNKLRATSARLAALKFVENANEPSDATTIHNFLREKHIRCDLVTIYRMMESFVSKGIVTQIDFQDGKYRYEIMNDHHHHLVCTQCGKIQAIHGTCISIDTEKVHTDYGFKIMRHQLEYFGLCNQCNRA